VPKELNQAQRLVLQLALPVRPQPKPQQLARPLPVQEQQLQPLVLPPQARHLL
jgi:hypothetical protein